MSGEEEGEKVMIRVELRDKKWRLIDDLDEVAANLKTGKPIDGGGHDDEAKARRQAGYLNAAFEVRQKLNAKLANHV